MKKLDRLGWAAARSFAAFGVRIGIRANDARVLDRLEEYFPPGAKPCEAERVDRLYSLIAGGPGERRGVYRYNLLYGDHEELARSRDEQTLFAVFESDVQLAVAALARRRVFVHAGVVGWKGKAIVLPGRTYTGKSTLVAELVKAGAVYYSDEFAVFDTRGRVHPFARRLALREGPYGEPVRYTPDQFGGRAGEKPLPVGLILASTYRSGARFRARPVSPGQGTLILLKNAVAARLQPGRVLTTLRSVSLRAPVLKGTRGAAEQTARELLEYFDQGVDAS